MPRDKPAAEPAPITAHVVYDTYATFTVSRSWQPAVNIYERPDGLRVCVELAGVDKRQIDVRVEPGRLTIRGVREAPEPSPRGAGGSMRIVCMEIDYGVFERVIALPDRVDLGGVTSTYRSGWLWVHLPYQVSGRP